MSAVDDLNTPGVSNAAVKTWRMTLAARVSTLKTCGPTRRSSRPTRSSSSTARRVLRHVPAAHTDGDSIVIFRKSDVVATGDIFRTDSYPVIDLARGGNVQGVLNGLNLVLDIAIPEHHEEGGTMIVPGHGRIADEFDLVEYRDIVTTSDRVRVSKVADPRAFEVCTALARLRSRFVATRSGQGHGHDAVCKA